MDEVKVPPELLALFKQQSRATQKGDIDRAIALQEEANAILRALGAEVRTYPREYFELMHEELNLPEHAHERRAQIYARLDEVYAEMGLDVPSLPEIPEECQALGRRMQALFKDEKHAEGIMVSRDYDRCLAKHGYPTQNLPDQYYELQAAAFAAMAQGDMVKFHTLMARVEQIKLDHSGMTPDEGSYRA